MFGIRDHCKNFYNIKICNRNKLEGLSEDSCLPKLLKGEQATCGFTNADHIPNLEEIDDGIILVNNFNGTVTGKDNAKKIQGTFLISFWNETISINGKEFSNTEMTIAEPGTPLIQLAPVEIERLRILSLEALEGLHLDNTEKLQKLKTHSTINRIALFAAMASLAILTFTLHWCRKRTVSIQLGNIHSEVARVAPINLQLGNINPELPKVAQRNLQLGNIDPEVTKVTTSTTYHPSSMQFNNIPFF